MPIRLERWQPDDLPVIEALYRDPAMMTHLGGPDTAEEAVDRLGRYVASDEPLYKVVVDGEPAGWVGLWAREWDGEAVLETGWSVLPGFQGRGIAARATRSLLDAHPPDAPRQVVHAFPSVENAASNAVCERLGFTLRGARELGFRGRVLLINDWRLDLRARAR